MVLCEILVLAMLAMWLLTITKNIAKIAFLNGGYQPI